MRQFGGLGAAKAVGIVGFAVEHQLAVGPVRHQMDGVQGGMGADNRRHLLPGIALGIEHHHFHISPCAFEQLGNVGHAAVNKDDFPGIRWACLWRWPGLAGEP